MHPHMSLQSAQVCTHMALIMPCITRWPLPVYFVSATVHRQTVMPWVCTSTRWCIAVVFPTIPKYKSHCVGTCPCSHSNTHTFRGKFGLSRQLTYLPHNGLLNSFMSSDDIAGDNPDDDIAGDQEEIAGDAGPAPKARARRQRIPRPPAEQGYLMKPLLLVAAASGLWSSSYPERSWPGQLQLSGYEGPQIVAVVLSRWKFCSGSVADSGLEPEALPMMNHIRRAASQSGAA